MKRRQRAVTSPPIKPGWLLAGALGAALCSGSPWVGAQTVRADYSGSDPPPAAQQPYLDRVLDPSPPQDAPLEQEPDSYDAEGWPRSLRLDYALGSQRGASRALSHAVSFNALLDTPNHGALSVAANLSAVRQDSVVGFAPVQTAATGHTWRIDQRALPLDGGWLAHHSTGNTTTIHSPLARGLGRVYLPTTPIEGVAGQWQKGQAAELNLAAGRAGLFNGLDINGFKLSGGDIATAGAQLRLAGGHAEPSRTDAAIQLVQARNVPENGLANGQNNTCSLWSALAWEESAPGGSGYASGLTPLAQRPGGLRLQANWLHSDHSRDGSAWGGWLDGAWRTELFHNTAGLFYFQPKLRWGATAAASDLRGMYWRADTSARQWQLGWTAELADSISGLYASSVFASLYGRYRLDTRNALGAALALRTGSGAGQSLQLSWDHLSDWGQTQWRSDYANLAGARTVRAGVDHSWPLRANTLLATSLAWERSSGAAATPSSAWSWGILSSYSPASGISLDASLRGAHGSSADALNANLGLAWQLQRSWSLIARYSEVRGRDPLSPLVVSALTAATQASVAPTPAHRSLQLILRYEERAGTASAPLGGLPGSGAGSLSGTVYFDADHNERRDASEAGAAGVAVVLDRRYVVRTDAQGRYEFPAVASGQHVLEIQADQVPLPWSPAAREPVKATVYMRQLTTQDFALQRDR